MSGAKNSEVNLQSAAPFSRIRFVLFGFSPSYHQQVKSKLVSVGGVDVGEYKSDCTHVVVHNTVYDDPICLTARKDGKTLVTSLWVDHSLDTGGPVDATSIMYRPPKDLSGIPGAKELVMCLTGYQRHEREDIMVMVGLMGAQFSKPLVANKVTHLICYKFEGEKYDLAKRMMKIKLVNRCWLEDCLKTWKILPEDRYSKSDYELEMMGAEARDSDDETGDIAGNITQGRSADGKNEMPTARENFDNAKATNLIFPVKEEKKLDQASASKGLNQIDKQSPVHQRQYQMNFKPDVNEQSTIFRSDVHIENDLSAKTSGNSSPQNFSSLTSSRKTPTRKSSLPLHGGDNMGNISEGSSKRFTGLNTGNWSPSSTKRSSGSSLSLQTAGNMANSDVRVEQNIAITNLESDNIKGAFACVGVQSSKQPSGSNSGKSSPLSSSKAPRKSSSLLRTAEKLYDSEKKLGEASAKKSVDTFTSNIEQGKGEVVSACFRASSIGNNLLNEEGSAAILPQKRKVGGQSNVSADTAKSQSLASAACKRIDAKEPKPPESSPLVKSKMDVFTFENDIENKSSPKASSVKSNAKKTSASRSLASEMLQGRNSLNMDATTSSNTGSVARSSALCAGNTKKAEIQNGQQKVSSPSCEDLKISKSTSAKLNSDDQIGNHISKPSRKKTVAKKTLGIKTKISKKTAPTCKDSLTENSIQDNAAIRPIGQTEVGHAKSPISPELMSDMGLKSLPKSYNAINKDAELMDDDTEAPDDLDGNFVTVKSSNVAETRTREGSSVLLSQTDEAVFTSPIGNVKEKLVKRKKSLAGRTKKKPVLDSKENLDNENEAEHGKTGEADIEREVIECVTGENSYGSLLMSKSKESVEVAKEPEAVINNVQGTSNVGKQMKKVGGKKRRGTLALNKPEFLNEVEGENEADLYEGREKRNEENHTRELTAKSNLINGPIEIEKENDPIVGNDQGTSKVGKLGKKLTGKKRHGTLVLNKSEERVEDGDEKEIAADDAEGRRNSEKSAKKLAGKSKQKAKKSDEMCADKNPPKKLTGKKRRGTLVLNKSDAHVEDGKENEEVVDDVEGRSNPENCAKKLSDKSKQKARKSDEMGVDKNTQVDLCTIKQEPARFLLSGHRLQRKEFQQIIKRLSGRICRDSHQWSYQATHLIVPDPLRRTEKFFAAVASGRWILKSDYLTASSQAGKLLPEEPYEWHKNGLNEDGSINLEAPRKWRLLRQKTGHGAFYGMRIVVYGEFIAPPLNTLKRVVKAGDGTILATSPPYSRFLDSGVDFAIVSPGMPRADIWIQEFLRHEVPCVSADYLVEYVCKLGYSLEKHVQYNTHEWAAKSHSKLLTLSEEIVTEKSTTTTAPAIADDEEVSDDDLACQVCGSTDKPEVMLICGDETGVSGCGLGMHIGCLNPPLEGIPEEDWFCPKCTESKIKPSESTKKKQSSSKRRK